MVKKLFITPASIPADETCRTLNIPNQQDWLGIFNAAILTLTQPYNYEQLHDTDLTPDECAALAMQIYADYLLTNACAAKPAPYWDDPEADDAITGESNPEFPFYHPIEDWIIAGFVAYAGGIGAAITFLTIAPQFRLAFQKHDLGGIVKIFMDAIELGEIDTYAPAPSIVNFDVISTGSTIKIECVGQNPAVLGLPQTRVLRKRLWEQEIIGNFTRYNPTTQEFETFDTYTNQWGANDLADPRNNPVYLLPARTGVDVRCNMAANATAKLRAILEAYLTASSIIGAINAIGAIISIFMPPMALLVHIIRAVITALIAIGNTAIGLAFTQSAWDELLCIIYTEIDDSGLITAAQKDAIYASIETNMSGITFSVLSLLINMLGEVGLSNAASTGVETGNCADCADWCYTFDFTMTDGAFALVNIGAQFNPQVLGSYVASTGWNWGVVQTVGQNLFTRGVYISRVVTDTTVTSIDVVYDKTNGDWSASAARKMQIAALLNGGVVIDTGLIGSETDGTNKIANWTGDQQIDTIILRNDCAYGGAGGANGVALLKSVTIRGIGVNPFGTDNCE